MERVALNQKIDTPIIDVFVLFLEALELSLFGRFSFFGGAGVGASAFGRTVRSWVGERLEAEKDSGKEKSDSDESDPSWSDIIYEAVDEFVNDNDKNQTNSSTAFKFTPTFVVKSTVKFCLRYREFVLTMTIMGISWVFLTIFAGERWRALLLHVYF